MNDYLDIFSDVVLLATFQPRQRERYSPSRPGEAALNRPGSYALPEPRQAEANRSRTIGMTFVP
jgi:hypothetical protein